MKPLMVSDINRIDEIDSGIRSHRLVIVRDAVFQSLEEFEQWGGRFGPLRKQVAEQVRPALEMNAMAGDHRWYNTRVEWPLHFDGVMTLDVHPIMPRTLLFGKTIDQVEGGVTYFYDGVEIMDVLRAQYGWKTDGTEMIVYKYPQATESFTFNLIRTDPHSGRSYPFLDEWFVQTDVRRKAEFRCAMEQCEPYFHHWRTGDLLFWSNEGFIHGRTVIESGDRLLWRLVVDEL